MAKKRALKITSRNMTSRLAYGLGHGVFALACLALAPTPAKAQPYTNRPTVVVDLGSLDPYGYPPESDYTQDIQSMPVAPPGAPENLSPTGMNAPLQMEKPMQPEQPQKLILPQFAKQQAQSPFKSTNRQLTKPVLEDILDSAASYDAGQQATGTAAKPSHDEIFDAAVASAAKAPPPPAGKPTDIQWQESAFDDIIKPAAPAHKPVVDDTATAALAAAAPKPKTISPFHQPAAVMQRGAESLSLNFEKNSVVLDAEDKISLDGLISRMDTMPDARLQLRAYASENPEDSVSGARRLSLSRALTVRAYLMQQNVSPTRIDVRALGSDVPQGPADRVDLVVVQ